jgi:hypothetical protein
MNMVRPKIRAQSHWLHIDSATPHNSALSLQKTEELGFTRLAQPPYFPNLAPCHFFLFGDLKKELHRKNFESQNVVISVMRGILTKIPIRILSRVFDEWIERLHGCVANEGEYI